MEEGSKLGFIQEFEVQVSRWILAILDVRPRSTEIIKTQLDPFLANSIVHFSDLLFRTNFFLHVFSDLRFLIFPKLIVDFSDILFWQKSAFPSNDNINIHVAFLRWNGAVYSRVYNFTCNVHKHTWLRQRPAWQIQLASTTTYLINGHKHSWRLQQPAWQRQLTSTSFVSFNVPMFILIFISNPLS